MAETTKITNNSFISIALAAVVLSAGLSFALYLGGLNERVVFLERANTSLTAKLDEINKTINNVNYLLIQVARKNNIEANTNSSAVSNSSSSFIYPL